MEMNFQKVVLIIAIILLIISLVTIGMMLKSALLNRPWPPSISQCPDYWNISENGCVPNKINVGIPVIKTPIDFSTANYKTNCLKQTWATNNKVTWDGLTDSPSLC
jgi:hypothetical protein